MKNTKQIIEDSLQLNVDKQKTKITVNTDKNKSVMKVTHVTFNEKRYMTFEDFKEEIMFCTKHIVDVKYKLTNVFIYFDCKISEV